MQDQVQHSKHFDVLVLGGSIAGTLTALALTGCGWQVAVVDKGVHPRFALGESMLKPTVLWMRLLAKRFTIPEVDVIANYQKITQQIGTGCGVKKCFGFVRHEVGNPRIVDQWWSNVAVSYEADVIEAHMFRQDIDAYLFRAATERCALALSGADVTEIKINQEGVELPLGGQTLKAKFLVDCTGPQSKLAHQFGLREKPTRYRSSSRSIFTHMINVVPFDQCDAAREPALDWHDGTLHHILDEGWIWVIPFDNHPSSTNPIVSVGMTYNCELSPKSELTAEQEWQLLLEKYPALRAQFANARPIRPWISTGELQYSASSAIADRFCLLGAAYGGIDALFSRGLLNTMQSIYQITELLDQALHTESFQTERFQPLQDLQENLLEINDLLTYGTYAGLRSSRLTTWWLTIWTFVEQKSIAHAENALTAHGSHTDGSKQFQHELAAGLCISNEDQLLGTLRSATEIMDSYKRGETNEADTHQALLALSSPLGALGYNYPIFQRLLKELGFNRASRVLLQTEHELVALFDEIDRRLALPRPLRTHPLIMCLSRMICAGAVARHKENKQSDAPLLLALSGQPFVSRLTEIMHKWVLEPDVRTQTQASIEKITGICYRHQQTPLDSPASISDNNPWIPLLQSRDNNRPISIYYRNCEDASNSTELRIDSNTEHVSLQLSLLAKRPVFRELGFLMTEPETDTMSSQMAGI